VDRERVANRPATGFWGFLLSANREHR